MIDPDEVDRASIKRQLRPNDTQTLKMVRCGSCGKPTWYEVNEEKPELCLKCDADLMETRVRLYLDGKRLTHKPSKLDSHEG